MANKVENLIFGLGLAGSNLALALKRHGRSFHAFDDADPKASSRIAAGLISPLSGQRTALQWRCDELLAAAQAAYGPHYHPMPILRIFQNEEQRRLFLARKAEPKHSPWLSDELPASYFSERGVHAPLGGIEVKGGGWLDCAAWLSETRDSLAPAIHTGPIDFAALRIERDGVHYQEYSAERAIFCLGVRARAEGPHRSLPFQPTRGELLNIQAEAPDESKIYYGSHFAIPQGQQRFKVGATYDRVNLLPKVSTAGRAMLHDSISQLFTNRILSSQAGLRPNILGHFPVLGPSAAEPRYVVFNGLGSKGALWAPACAEWLTEANFSAEGLPKELRADRF